MPTRLNELESKFINDRWLSTTTLAVDTDWFATDIVPLITGTSVKHVIQIMVPTATVVNVQLKRDSITKVYNLNDGVTLAANSGLQFDLMLKAGDSYNIQHKTATQNVSCTIFEALNADI